MRKRGNEEFTEVMDLAECDDTTPVVAIPSLPATNIETNRECKLCPGIPWPGHQTIRDHYPWRIDAYINVSWIACSSGILRSIMAVMTMSYKPKQIQSWL